MCIRDRTEVDYDELFRQGPGAIWTLPATAEMWESGALDLTPVLESVKADVRDFAAVTRTPLSYLFPDACLLYTSWLRPHVRVWGPCERRF